MATETRQTFATELADLSSLKAHPRNYRRHPDDEIDHLMESIREHGVYRNIVCAKDGTVLAGHGVLQACAKLGMTQVPIYRTELDPNEARALKLLAGDNEISHLCESDDRALTELLKEIAEQDIDGLLGTGYDELMLANLLLVTRPASEIADIDTAAEWTGLPGFSNDGDGAITLIVKFRCMEDRHNFATLLAIKDLPDNAKGIWFPAREMEDLASVILEG